MADADLDSRVRAKAFQFLREQTDLHSAEVLPRDVPTKGFEFDGQRVPLIAAQGIFKPAGAPEMPPSITSVPVVEGEGRPYDDGVEGMAVSRLPGLTVRGPGSSFRPTHALAYFLGVEQRALLVG